MFSLSHTYLLNSKPLEDIEFDKIYSDKIRALSKRHFTPISVAMKASTFLVDNPESVVLDIGSGLGKFCFVSGIYFNAKFVGIDYRKNFVEQCRKIAQKGHVQNVEFIHSNIIDFDISSYNRLYFFNSFQEHIDPSCDLDDTIVRDPLNYKRYTEEFKDKLDKMPIGTKLAAYYTYNDQIPFSYKLVDIQCNGNLKFWEKTKVQKRDRFYKEVDWIKQRLSI